MSTRQKIISGLAALLVLGLLAVCYFVSPRRPVTNVLFITLDTTRADRLGCYGYARALTPALDRVANDGVLFERAYSPVPLTLPSHASMFTGLYPTEHGLTTNGRSQLDAAIPTLATGLESAGYDTGAFVASFVVDAKFGLKNGFSVYDDDMSRAEPTGDALHRQRDGRVVTDAALAWLQSPRTTPFFCWVHLYDAHVPYVAHPAEFENRFRDQLYDGEIAYVDLQVQRLLDQLKQLNLDDETLVVIAGDHGESLGDHLERTHGYTLYEATQRVPLMFRLPKRLVAGHRAPEVVSLVDVYPTVLDLLGLSAPVRVTGRSLLPALQGKPMSDRPVHSATDDPFLQNGWSPLRSVTTERWKYIRTAKPELYDLQADPGEAKNLAQSNGPELTRMAETLERLESQMSRREAAAVQLSGAERRALESLGYVRGPGSLSEPTGASELPDIKDMLRYDVATQAALDLLAQNKVPEAVSQLREVVAESPFHVASRVMLGEALERQGKMDEALTWYQDALKIKADSLDALVHLGSALASLGRTNEAVTQLDEALRIDPLSTSARYNLGLAMLYLGKADEAIAQLEETLRIDEDFPNARAALGRTLIALGRPADAMPYLKEEIEHNPKSVEARLNLATLIADSDPDSAERLLREALRLGPEDPQANYNLGAFLLFRGRTKEAIAPLEEAVRLMPKHPRAAAELERAKQKNDKK